MAASFVMRRFFSSTAALRVHFRLQHTLAVPAPTHLEAVLPTPELKSLHTKAARPWKQLSKEEVVQLYRATFPLSVKEMKNMEEAVKLYRATFPLSVMEMEEAVKLHRATFPLSVKEIKNKEEAIQLETENSVSNGFINIGLGAVNGLCLLLFGHMLADLMGMK